MDKSGLFIRIKSFLKEHRLTLFSNPYFYMILATHFLVIYAVPENSAELTTSPSAIQISKIWSTIALSLLNKDFEKRTSPKTWFVNRIPFFFTNLLFWSAFHFVSEIKPLLFN